MSTINNIEDRDRVVESVQAYLDGNDLTDTQIMDVLEFLSLLDSFLPIDEVKAIVAGAGDGTSTTVPMSTSSFRELLRNSLIPALIRGKVAITKGIR